jgi:hypothetical protein
MKDNAVRNLYSNAVTISETENGELIVVDNDGNDIEIDESLITAEVTRLQAEYDSQQYARNRKAEYDQLNQFEMQFDDDRDGTTTWVDKINEIKGRHPK